jgi:hypothetical protein
MLDRVHKISEIVAAFAIVGSLVFVGIQLQQNTSAIDAERKQSAMNAWNATTLAVATSETLSNQIMEAVYPIYQQQNDDHQAQLWVSAQLNTIEHQYLQLLNGELSEEMWQGFENGLHDMFRNSQVHADYWQYGRKYHSRRFQALVDELIPVEAEKRQRHIEEMGFEEGD